MAVDIPTLAEMTVGRFLTQPVMRKFRNTLIALVGASSGSAGIPNGSFEIDADSDGQPDQWDTNTYTGGTIGLETTSPIDGAASLKMVHPGGAGNGGGYADSDFVECAPAKALVFSLIHYCSAAGMKDQVIIRYFDKDQADLSLDSTIYSSTSNPTSATLMEAQDTPPSTAKYLKIRLVGGYTDTDVAGSSYWDAVSVREVIRQETIGNSEVGQAQLKTSTGSVSVNGSATFVQQTLPGGSYGFYPQIKMSGTNNIAWDARMILSSSQVGWTSYATIIALHSDSVAGRIIYAQQRYVQASPPHQVGNKKWGHFIFVLRRTSDGMVMASYEAPDPPWYHNGLIDLPKDDIGRIAEIPHPFVDYWDRDPAEDGLEVVLVDTTGQEYNNWHAANIKKPVIEHVQDIMTVVLPNRGRKKKTDLVGHLPEKFGRVHIF